MRPTTTAESSVRGLLASVDEQRLRALVAEFPSALLHVLSPPSPGSGVPKRPAAPAGNGGRRPRWRERRAAIATKPRPRRAAKGNGRRRPGRKPRTAPEPAGNGAETPE